MNLDDYQRQAARTLPDLMDADLELNMTLGIAGEAGEIVERVKKTLYHRHEFDRDAMCKELGDLMWYVAGLATTYNLRLSDIATANIAKLRARYPEGFSHERSRNRDVEHEIVASVWQDEAEAYAKAMGFAGATE